MHLQNVNMWPYDLRPLLHLLLQQIQPFCGQCTWGFGATKMPKRDFLNNAVFINVFHDQDMFKEKQNDQFNRILFMFKISLIQLRSWILILWHNNQIVVSKCFQPIFPKSMRSSKWIIISQASKSPEKTIVDFVSPTIWIRWVSRAKGTDANARHLGPLPYPCTGPVCYKNSIKGL